MFVIKRYEKKIQLEKYIQFDWGKSQLRQLRNTANHCLSIVSNARTSNNDTFDSARQLKSITISSTFELEK